MGAAEVAGPAGKERVGVFSLPQTVNAARQRIKARRGSSAAKTEGRSTHGSNK